MKTKIYVIVAVLFGMLSACGSDKSGEAGNDQTPEVQDEEQASDNMESEKSGEEFSDQAATQSFVGTWKLMSYVDKQGEALELSECDIATVWTFTEEPDEPLGDGTEVQKMMAVAPDDCKYYGFEAKWTTLNDQIFISKTKIGGIPGPSMAGLFKVVEHSADKMVLTILGATYTFSRV